MAKKTGKKRSSTKRRCGLCGKTTKLTSPVGRNPLSGSDTQGKKSP